PLRGTAMRRSPLLFLPFVIALCLPALAGAQKVDVVSDVEGQPLAENIKRLLSTLDFLGSPLSKEATDALQAAAAGRDAGKLQKLLDPHVLLQVAINPESRVKVARGQADAVLQQHGFTPVIVKVVNESTVKKALHIQSPQAGPRQKTDYSKRTTPKDAEIKNRF